MNIDVSEIKTLNACKRQWLFSSRNRYHIVPKTPAKALALGTLFHEALAQMYLGASYEAIMKLVLQEMSPDDVALKAMLKGYYNDVFIYDAEKWKVLDVEYRFNFDSGLDPVQKIDSETGEVTFETVNIVGSIDLIVYEEASNTVYGIEHKTCSTFRDAAFFWMDEQPRVYTVALNRYVEEAIAQGRLPSNVTIGGLYINEVKKLLRDFQYRRSLCVYDPEDQMRFWNKWMEDVAKCREAVELADVAEAPSPGYFTCSMCAYKTICAAHGYRCISKETILEDYGAEFRERDCDHLDEKLDFGKRLEVKE